MENVHEGRRVLHGGRFTLLLRLLRKFVRNNLIVSTFFLRHESQYTLPLTV